MDNYFSLALKVCIYLMNYFRDVYDQPDNIYSTLNYTTFRGHFQVATYQPWNVKFLSSIIDKNISSYESFARDFTKKLNNKALCLREKHWIWSDSVTCFISNVTKSGVHNKTDEFYYYGDLYRIDK